MGVQYIYCIFGYEREVQSKDVRDKKKYNARHEKKRIVVAGCSIIFGLISGRHDAIGCIAKGELHRGATDC